MNLVIRSSVCFVTSWGASGSNQSQKRFHQLELFDMASPSDNLSRWDWLLQLLHEGGNFIRHALALYGIGEPLSDPFPNIVLYYDLALLVLYQIAPGELRAPLHFRGAGHAALWTRRAVGHGSHQQRYGALMNGCILLLGFCEQVRKVAKYLLEVA